MSETHHVWTEDGYRLDVHRVLSKANENVCTKLCEEDIDVRNDRTVRGIN